MKKRLTYGTPYDTIITGGEIRDEQEKQKKKELKKIERIIILIIKALVGIGAFMTGLSSLINSLK